MSQLQEPSAPKIKHIFEEFGKQRIDNYYWMNKRDSKEVIDYITEENNYTNAILKSTEKLQDEVVFEELDDTFDVYVNRSKSGKYIWVQSHSTLSSEVQFLSADNPNSKLQIISKREKDHEYDVSNIDDTFYIKTNWKAKNFRLMKCKVDDFSKDKWIEVIPNREDVLFEEFELFNNYLVIEERKAGLLNIRIIDKSNSNIDYNIDFGEPSYLASLSTNPTFDTDKLRFVYSSLSTPNSTFEFDMRTKEKTLLKEKEVLGDFNKNNYQVERLQLTARDGKKIPVSVVYKKGLKKDGSNPLLLYGYGSYGYTIDAGFNFDRLSLLNRGFIYVIAHIRGGEDLGRSWYEDGKLLNKKNTFYDFIDCGKELIKLKYTNSNKMFAMGGSAGGLLMGAVLNYEPTLFKGMIAAVPFVDVMTTMFDESIPLTTSEYDEWGNPNNETYYDYMLSYSPYDNVESKAYTNLLITSGYHDSQVQYWEPLKWIAKLRDYRTNKSNLLLLHMQMEAGHGGASGRYQKYKETALEYAFLLKLLEN
jgi:oligopeptidase B